MLVQMLFFDVITSICRSGFGGCHAAKKTMINGSMTPLLPLIKGMFWRCDGCQALVGTCVLA